MLIATDLDGTLVPPDQSGPSPFTARVLARADRAGIPLVFVTARPLRWMEGFWPHVGRHGRAVVSNGAVVYDVPARTARSVRGLSPATGLDVVAAISAAVPGATFAIECLDGIRLGADYVELHDVPDGAPRGPLEQLWDVPALKLLVRHNGMDAIDGVEAMAADEFRDGVVRAVGDAAVATWTVDGLVEISAAGVTKASALVSLCDELGVGQDEVVAFGDMPNDLPMLRWAGRGHAVANAHPEVLAAADAVVGPNDDDGVAAALEAALSEVAGRPGVEA